MSSIRNAGDTVYDTGSRTLASESQSTPFSVDGNPGKVSLSDLRGTRAVVNLSKVALPVDQLSSATSCGPLTLSSVFQELSIQFTTEARRNHDTYEITMKYPDRRASTNDGLNQPVGDFSAEGSICFRSQRTPANTKVRFEVERVQGNYVLEPVLRPTIEIMLKRSMIDPKVSMNANDIAGEKRDRISTVFSYSLPGTGKYEGKTVQCFEI